jgi:hypothetical protein
LNLIGILVFLLCLCVSIRQVQAKAESQDQKLVIQTSDEDIDTPASKPQSSTSESESNSDSASASDSADASVPPLRVVAIGDFHGDFDSVHRVMMMAGLVDSDLNWVGGTDTVLVQTVRYVFVDYIFFFCHPLRSMLCQVWLYAPFAIIFVHSISNSC